MMSKDKIVKDFLGRLKSKNPTVRLESTDQIPDLVKTLWEELDNYEEFFDIPREFILTMLDRLAVEKNDNIRERLIDSIREIADKFVYSYEWIIKKLESISNDQSKYLLDLLLEMQKERDEYIKGKLFEKTNHRYKKSRIEAIYELGKTALDKKEVGVKINYIIDILIECLNDKEELVAEEAGKYLFEISTDYVMKKLFQVLQKKRAYTNLAREKAIKALGTILVGNSNEELINKSIKLFLEIIRKYEEPEELRSMALWGYAVIESSVIELIQNLYDLHKEDESEIIRNEAYDFLKFHLYEIGYKISDIEEIISMLESEDNEWEEDAIPQNLILNLSPSSEILRLYAAKEISKLNSEAKEKAIPCLLNSIRFDESERVREASASILININSHVIIDNLMAIILNPDLYDALAKKYSIRILTEIGITKSKLRIVSALIDDLDSRVRAEVALSLGKIGTKKDLPIFIKLLNDDKSVNVRINSLEALFAIDQKTVLPLLLNVARHDKSSKIRQMALGFIEIINPTNFPAILREIIHKDYSYRVREKAKEILLKIPKGKQLSEEELNVVDKPIIEKSNIKKDIQLLFVAANPIINNFLRQGREIRTIENKLSRFYDRFLIRQKWAINSGDLTEIFKSEPHFLHITCHGTDTGELVFEGEDGKDVYYPAKEFGRRFADAKITKSLDNLHCVFISACHSELIAAEILECVDCVVAMSDSIFEDSARKFAGQFYKEISYGENLLSAFQNACEELIIEREEEIPDIFFKPGNRLKRLDFDEEIKKEETQLHEKSIREPFKSLFEKLKLHEKIDSNSLLKIISEGENDLVELKSSFRWDIDRNIPTKTIEYRIAKSIASFMNTNGGILFIGVGDKGDIRGLEKDYSTLGRNQNKDGFSNQLKNVISDNFDDSFPYSSLIHDNYLVIKNKEICAVYVEPSPKPVFIKEKGSQVFIVRYPFQSRKISGNQQLEYIKNHWKN